MGEQAVHAAPRWRRPDTAAELNRYGRGWYPFKQPALSRHVSADDVVDAIYETPASDGGRANRRRNRQFIRHIEQLWTFLLAEAERKRSDAFAISQRQLIKHMRPDLLRSNDLTLIDSYRNSLHNWMDAIQAAGYVQWGAQKDHTGRYWRTIVELLDRASNEKGLDWWHSYTELATQGFQSATPSAYAPVLEAPLAPEQPPLFEPLAEPPRSRFPESFSSPCRDEGLAVEQASRPQEVLDTQLVREVAASPPSFDAIEPFDDSTAPTTLGGWREGQGVAERSAERRARPLDRRIEVLSAAVRAGADPVPAIRAAYELLAERPPVLTRRRTAQLLRLLERGDRLGLAPGFDPGTPGAAAGWLIEAMADHYLDGEPIPIRRALRRGGTRSPEGLAGWVLVLKREYRRAQVGAGRRQSPAWRAGEPGDPRIGGAPA